MLLCGIILNLHYSVYHLSRFPGLAVLSIRRLPEESFSITINGILQGSANANNKKI